MVSDIEKFENKVTKNNFRTIEEATGNITRLKEQIAEKIRKMDGKEEVD